MAKKASSRRFVDMSFFVDTSVNYAEYVSKLLAFEGAVIHKRLTADTGHLVIGERKNGKPHACEKQVAELAKQGAQIKILNEKQYAALIAPTPALFGEWMRMGNDGADHAGAIARSQRPPAGKNITLSNVDLAGVTVTTHFGGCVNLPGVTLENAEVTSFAPGGIDGANCRGLKATVFFSADSAKKASFVGATLAEARFDDISEADFTQAQMGEFSVQRKRGERANFTETVIREAHFYEAKLGGAKFTRAKIDGADFRVADLSGANLAGASLKNARFEYAKLKGADLSGADVRGARFVFADLSGAKLDGANFEGALIGGCNLKGTNVSKAQGFVAREPGGKFGPFAKALEALDKKSKMITADMLLETTLGDVGIRFEAYGGALRWHSTEGVPDCASNALGFAKMFHQFVEGWWPHTTGIKKLSTTGVKCPLKGEKLTEAVEAALVEVFGLASAGTPAPATPPARSAKKSPSKAAPKKRAKPRRAGR